MTKNIKIGIFLSAVVGIAFSILIYSFINNSEQNKIRVDFEHKSNNLLKTYKTIIEKNLDTVVLIASFFSNVKEPTRDEFKNIAKSAIGLNSVTTGISWNPFVENSLRDLYEKSARDDGLLDFRFTGLNEEDKRVDSPIKSDYVPIYYIEPQLENIKALGFDISSNSDRNKAIQKARDTGEIILTDRINLVQQNSFGTLAMKAVYAKNKKNSTIEERRQNFKGIVVGVFSFNELGEEVLEQLNLYGIKVNLKDPLVIKDKQLLYEYQNKEVLDKTSLTWEGSIEVADRKWLFKTFASSKYIESIKSNYAIYFLIIGFLLTLIWVNYLFSKVKRTTELERKVRDQTEDIVFLNEKFKEAQRIAHIGSWYLNIVDNKLQWSDELYSILEIDKNKFEASSDMFNGAIHPDDKVRVNKAYLNSLQDKKRYKIIHRLLMKDGRVKWVEEQCKTTFDEKGNPIVSIGTVQDITEQKEKDLLFLEQSKMAVLGDMIGNIAHQWRQPLNSISVAASSIKVQKEFGKLNDKDLDMFIKGIVDSANFLSQTINTFRNFIKGDKKYEAVSLQTEIKLAIQIVEISLKQNQITLFHNLSYENNLIVKMVTNELAQVIINILNNAKDILKEKEIKEPWIKLDLVKLDDKALITIEDNGGGIPKNSLTHIFEPYFTTKHKSQGTGLGLHMSYQIIKESLNGNIYVRNTENGAKFFIELPLRSE